MIHIKHWEHEFAQSLQLPNIIIENGLINRIIYVNKNNEKHRNSLTGPAYIEYYESGKIRRERYYKNDKLHRLDVPAVIRYCENGNIDYKEYYENDKLHRLDGPALIKYYENGNINYKQYYENDNLIPHNN